MITSIALLALFCMCSIGWWIFAQAVYYSRDVYCVLGCGLAFDLSILILIAEYYIIVVITVAIFIIDCTACNSQKYDRVMSPSEH